MTVVIVTYNSETVIEGCLRSLGVGLEGIEHDVVVADNASSDLTLDIVRRVAPSAVALPMGSNRGYSAAINAAIGHVPPRGAVLVLNPDVRLEPGCVAAMLAALVDRTGIAVPCLLDEAGGRQQSLRREPTASRALAEAILGGRVAARLGLGEVVAPGPAYDTAGPVDWATGAVMLVARDCLADVGGFDESFFLYSEETDFMLRARDSGWATSYVPSARVRHIGGELTRSPRLWSMRTLNRVRLHRRRHTRRSAAAFLVASLLGEGGRALAGKATSRAAFRDLVVDGPAIVLGPPPVIEPAVPGWICFSAQDWWYFNRAHSDFQLMQPIGRRRQVLLVNSIGLRVPLPGRSTAPAARVLRKARSVARFVRRPVADNPGFHVMTPVPLPLYGSDRRRRIGSSLVRIQVLLVARLLGIIGPGRPDPVIVVTLPTAIGAAQSLPHSALVVYRSDRHSSFVEADGGVIRGLEEACVTQADLVFYSATALRDEEAEWAGNRALDLDHGVDIDLFTPSQDDPPADIAELRGPIIGFFGAIRDHLVDLDLLEAVATRIPDAQLVIVGPVNCPPERVAPLASLPNVHLLGARPHEAIPAYGRTFDVALMPWTDSEWIRYSNPIKMKEYLALGLAIVSTDFPEVHRYDGLVRIARDTDGFVAAVEQTLRDGGLSTPQERRAAVIDATWNAASLRLQAAAEDVGRHGASCPEPTDDGAGEQLPSGLARPQVIQP